MTVDKEAYLQLLSDRPQKFTPAEVAYRDAEAEEPSCGSCVHFFIGVAAVHCVCEIMRPPDEHVEPDHTCKFQTRDYETFPLIDVEVIDEEEDDVR